MDTVKDSGACEESIQDDSEHRWFEDHSKIHNEGSMTFTFPAPVTEGLSHGVAAAPGQSGLWAYVANTGIIVVKSAEDLSRNWPIFTMLDASGWDTYSSVSFCRSDREAWPIPESPLVGATDGGYVRIFNVESGATVKFHDYHSGHRTIAEWSPRNPRFVFGVDDIGQLSVWDVVDHSCVLMSFDDLQTNCMAVSPHEDDIVALGDKDGKVTIVHTVGTGSILQRTEHYEEIFNLGWKPCGDWPASAKFKCSSEFILAISFKSFKPALVALSDRDGNVVGSLAVPPPAQVPAPAAHVPTVQRKLFMRSIPSLWTHSRQADNEGVSLMSIDPVGKLISWTDDTEPQVVHELNSRCGIFGLVQSGHILWSVSSEPHIVGWNMLTNKVETIIPTYNGICSISCSNVENTRFALGGVDSYLRVLKIDRDYPNGTVPEMPLLPAKLQGKITAVAFHPFMDKVGLGTDGGIIGVYDLKAGSPYVMEFSKRVGGIIYTADWGPKCYSEDFKPKTSTENTDGKGKSTQYLCLFVCGNRNAYVINPGKRDNALISVSRIIGDTNGRDENYVYSTISDIKWSPDHVYLAVGYNCGKIELYTAPHLRLRCWIKCHSSSIQFLCWHTLDFTEDVAIPKQKYLASAANDGTAKIHDLREIYEPDFVSNEVHVVLEFISSQAILNGHRGIRVIQVVWSPHEDNHVLTVSYDTTAVLWDVTNLQPKPIARYMGHEHRLVACEFHPTNPYMILTCSDEMMVNSCFHMWDYREHPEVEEYQEKLAQKSMIGSTVECVKALAVPRPKLLFRQGAEDEAVGRSKAANKPVRQDGNSRLMAKIRDRMTLLPLLTHHQAKNTLMAELEFVVDAKPLPDPEKLTTLEKDLIIEQGSIVKKLSKVDALVDAAELKEVRGDLGTLEPDYHLKLFGTKEDAEFIVQREFEGHLNRGDFYAAESLLGWTHNPAKMLLRLAEFGQMTETMVIFARKCSKKEQWDWARSFARHLVTARKFSEAAWYFWNILESFDEAYGSLVEGGMLLEALIFSKVNRLPGFGQAEDEIVLDMLAGEMDAQNVSRMDIAKFYTAMGFEYGET